MVATLSHSIVDINDSIVAMLTAAQQENGGQLDIKTVYYGRQALIPEFPSVTVEQGRKNRTLDKPASTHKYSVDFTCIVTLFQCEVNASDIKDRDIDVLSEQVENLLNANYLLGGLVIFGHVTANEPVVVRGQSVFYRARRLTWGGDSREIF